MIIDLEAYLRDRTFVCPRLRARITPQQCVARQTSLPKLHKARGCEVPYWFQPPQDVYCRSGCCELGKEQLVRLEK